MINKNSKRCVWAEAVVHYADKQNPQLLLLFIFFKKRQNKKGIQNILKTKIREREREREQPSRVHIETANQNRSRLPPPKQTGHHIFLPRFPSPGYAELVFVLFYYSCFYKFSLPCSSIV